jgi:hypothetical protein
MSSDIRKIHGFFTEYEKFFVFRKMSNEWYMIDRPLIDIAEITEREIVSVDDESVRISKISDRLLCLYV